MISVRKATAKDFGNLPNLDAFQRAAKFHRFTDFMAYKMNHSLVNRLGFTPEMYLKTPYHTEPQKCICFVTSDYLNFSQHPKVKEALRSKAKGYQRQLKSRIAAFYQRDSGESAIFTTEYVANSSALSSLLKSEDIAMVEMGTNKGVYEGLKHTHFKIFTQNNLDELGHILHAAKDNYLTKFVVVNGVHPLDGSIAPLADIHTLAKRYGAYLMVNDAHSIGVLGDTGRGVLEDSGLLNRVDVISGTFGNALGHTGGYIIADPKIIKFLKCQSYQHAFDNSRTAMGIIKAIDLIDEEPHWRDNLWQNINRLKKGLLDLGMDIGTTNSAIIPVKIGHPHITTEVARLLLKKGIFTSPILNPTASKDDSHIRMSIMATHTSVHIDLVLNAFEHINKRYKISRE